MPELTDRQLAVLKSLAAGFDVYRIAADYDVDARTIRRDMAALRANLNAHTTAQLIDRAWRCGLLTGDTPTNRSTK